MMKSTWMTWLLAGALVASLQWNLRELWIAPSASTAQGAYDSASSTCESDCALDTNALGLTEEQAAKLDELCLTDCARADEMATRAEEKLAALRVKLSDADVDEDELRELVDEVSELRERSLDAAVDSVLSVRAILSQEQTAALIESCARVGAGGPSCSQ